MSLLFSSILVCCLHLAFPFSLLLLLLLVICAMCIFWSARVMRWSMSLSFFHVYIDGDDGVGDTASKSTYRLIHHRLSEIGFDHHNVLYY